MQAQDTKEAAVAQDAEAKAELADLRSQLLAMADENDKLQAETRELKQALAVRAPEAQLTAAQTHHVRKQHPPAFQLIRSCDDKLSRQVIYLGAGMCTLTCICCSLLHALLLHLLQPGHAIVVTALHT